MAWIESIVVILSFFLFFLSLSFLSARLVSEVLPVFNGGSDGPFESGHPSVIPCKIHPFCRCYCPPSSKKNHPQPFAFHVLRLSQTQDGPVASVSLIHALIETERCPVSTHKKRERKKKKKRG